MLIRKLRLLLKINAFDLERFEFKFLNREGTLSKENLLSVVYEICYSTQFWFQNITFYTSLLIKIAWKLF